METNKATTRDARAERQSEANNDMAGQHSSTSTSTSTWASAAHRRLGGKIGDGLLHNIEVRLGSIA